MSQLTGMSLALEVPPAYHALIFIVRHCVVKCRCYIRLLLHQSSSSISKWRSADDTLKTSLGTP